MVRLPLRVDQHFARGALFGEQGDQPNQCHLGGVTCRVEHGFAGEERTQRDAVHAADQLVVRVPDLHAVSNAKRVKALVGLDDLSGDPVTSTGGIPTALDHRLERSVDAEVVPTRRPRQRPRHHQSLGTQHAPVPWRVPAEPGGVRSGASEQVQRAVDEWHREIPGGVGGHQCLGSQVGAGGNQVVSVGVGPGKAPHQVH